MEFVANLRGMFGQLDTRSKIAIGLLAGVLALGSAVFVAFLQPKAFYTIYTDVPRDELTRMGRVLAETGIDFELQGDRGAVLVDPASVDAARLVLAERGLPSSSSAGYELFDNVNSLGLTSFMQDVTRTRAIEGELARTIQMIDGVRTVRVHVVLPSERGYRTRTSDPATASVVIGTMGSIDPSTASSIQHLVAAAVRGLDTKNVTVLRTDGTLLSSAEDGVSGSSLRLAELEMRYEREVSEKVNLALGAHLGDLNYRVSVTAKLNSDSRRTNETIFFPESKVERSTRTVKEAGQQANTAVGAPATVQQNIPEEGTPPQTGQSSSENNEKREELTNYEISQKTVQTISEGYVVDKLAIALVVNRDRILELAGADATQEQIDAELEKLKKTISAAVGYSQERGDVVEVTALQFLPQDETAGDASGMGLGSFLGRHFSAVVSAITLIVGVVLFAFLVVRPILAFLKQNTQKSQPVGQLGMADGGLLMGPGLDSDDLPPLGDDPTAGLPSSYPGSPIIESRQQRITQQIVDLIEASDERAAAVIKQWLREDGEVTA